MEGANTYSAGNNQNPWTEILIEIPADHLDTASDIAQMTVPYGMYIEDYRNLEEETLEIAHIDLIDEDLIKKDRSKGIIHIYLEPGENPAEAVAFLNERFSACGIKSNITVLPCKREDWQNNWKKYFHPIEIGKKILIQPVWEETKKVDTSRKVLYIEPGLAFGTGTHETTKLCLEALEERLKGGEKVLDLGCGSGILGISALLLGGKSTTGVDIDELAVKTAVENGKKNGFKEPEYTVHCGNMTEKVNGKYNIILANIVADIIVPFCESAKTFMEDDSLFIVSGIIDSREPDVLKAFKDNGFEIIERKQKDSWLCFVLKKEV